MRAMLCEHAGPPASLVLRDVSAPPPGPGQVEIAVRAAGVNFLDLLLLEGRYQHQPPFPFAPGGEVAGIVTAVGAGVGGLAAGDAVIAFCTHGGFAERLVAEADRTMRMPAGMGFEAASSFVLTYGTALHALEDRGAMRPGETLLVLGAAGGAGSAAVEVGKALGARVIAAASGPDRCAMCRDRGADETIDYAAEDLRRRIADLTDGAGVDLVFDPVGGRFTQPALRGLAWGGRLLVVGFAAGEVPQVALNIPLVKSASILGISWGTFVTRAGAAAARHFERLAALYEAGGLRPGVAATFPLDRAGEALEVLAARRVAGRVAVLP